MKVLAHLSQVLDGHLARGIPSGYFGCVVMYACSDGELTSTVNVNVAGTQTEDLIKADIRAAVANDVNAKRGTSLTADDVRLI